MTHNSAIHVCVCYLNGLMLFATCVALKLPSYLYLRLFSKHVFRMHGYPYLSASSNTVGLRSTAVCGRSNRRSLRGRRRGCLDCRCSLSLAVLAVLSAAPAASPRRHRCRRGQDSLSSSLKLVSTSSEEDAAAAAAAALAFAAAAATTAGGRAAHLVM